MCTLLMRLPFEYVPRAESLVFLVLAAPSESSSTSGLTRLLLALIWISGKNIVCVVNRLYKTVNLP